ncbi:MAG: hypothetical protein V8R63_04120 [Thomasclavelia ramosa]
MFNNDGDFIYKAVNTNTNQMISQHSEKITTNDDQSKYSFYTEASYDQNGLVSCNGDLRSDKLSYFNIANLLSSFAHYDGENTIYIDNWMFDTNAIKINVPRIFKLHILFQKHQPVMDMLHNMLIHGKTIIIFQLLRY